MKVVIYGVGIKFSDIMKDKKFIEENIVQKGIDIVGFSDGNPAVWGRTVDWQGKQFEVRGIHEFPQDNVDEVWVTSSKYLAEIREDLLHQGYKDSQIISVYTLYYFGGRFSELDGIEVGGPTNAFLGIYNACRTCDGVNFASTTVWWEGHTSDFCYRGERLGNLYIADATDMSVIPDLKYDFLLSSNNLEHVANPLKALKEFARVLKPGGSIVLLVPRKTETFDHNREYTPFEHLLDDFYRDIGEDDLTHLPEIIEKHDYSMDLECGGKENFILRAQKNVENRCLHHHVFDENSLRKALEFAGFEVTKCQYTACSWCIIGTKR